MTAPAAGSAAAVWVSVLPDLGNFGRDLINQLGDAGQRGGQAAGERAEAGISRAAKGIAAAGAVAGAALGVALVGAMNVEKANDKLAAQLGLTGPESERYGRIAGTLYSGAYGDSLEQVNEALRLVTQNVGASATSSDADLQRITASVLDVATAFDQDLGGTTTAVGQLMKTGLATDATQALDIITAGFQNGADKSGDFLDTLNEYGGQFQKFGLDGATATGLLTQGLQAGARDADLVADAIKEFSIRAVDGSAATSAGFQALGLDGAEMARKIAAGGPEASGALDLVLDRLRAMPDPVQRSQAAVALFGTQAEDLGDALFALDPSSAVAALGQVAGASADLGITLNENAASYLESFKRQAISAFVNVIGGQVLPIVTAVALFLATSFGPALAFLGTTLNTVVIPALGAFGGFIEQNQVPIGIVAGLIAAVFIPHLVALAVQSTVTGVRAAAAWLVTQASALAAAAVHSAQVLLMIARWALMGVQALLRAGIVAASWLIMSASAIAAAVIHGVQVGVMVAGWILLGVQALLGAARVAAAWLIALGPIGLVIAAVVGLVALIIANWETVRAATAAVFTFIGNFLTTTWNSIVALFTTSTAFLQGMWSAFWSAMSLVASTAWNAVSGVIGFVWGIIKGLFQAAMALLRGDWDGFWNILRATADTVFGAIRSVIDTVWAAIRGVFQGGISLITGLWSGFWNTVASVAATVFGGVRSTVDTVIASITAAFRSVVASIGTIWGGIKRLLAQPINFLIGTVYNNGIVKAWNFVAGLIPGIGPIGTLPLIAENARGGIIPGYSPGRDDQLSRVSGGEAVMRPEWTRAVGPDFIHEANRVARTRGIGGAREFMADRRYPDATFTALQRGQLVEGADHEGPGFSTSGFGGVKPHVAKAGHFLKSKFGIGSVGGVGARANASDHPRGLALDFMTYADQAKGDRLVNYLIPNAGHFAVKYVIWKQRINSGSGWRGMEDRGSITANHMDHPHVSFLDGPGGGGAFSGEGGFFNPLPGLVRQFFDTFVNPLVAAIPGGPPKFRDIPKGVAGFARDKALSFFLGLVGGGGGGGAMDSGGLARGRGYMAKDIIAPERVLSPRQTVAFEKLVDHLDRTPYAAGIPTSGRDPGMSSSRVEAKLDELIALLRSNGSGASITVEDRSGDPVQVARQVQLALRLPR